jgi:hypothetical protein
MKYDMGCRYACSKCPKFGREMESPQLPQSTLGSSFYEKSCTVFPAEPSEQISSFIASRVRRRFLPTDTHYPETLDPADGRPSCGKQ